MRISRELSVLTGLALLGSANAFKGKTEVQACIWLATKPFRPFTVNWKVGSATDQCMKNYGDSESMTVEEKGLTCESLGVVQIDDDEGCYWMQSKYSISYTADKLSYSGSATSRWITGPWHTEIEIQNPGSSPKICGSQALCDNNALEWDNDNNNPVYFIFKPADAAGLLTQEELK